MAHGSHPAADTERYAMLPPTEKVMAYGSHAVANREGDGIRQPRCRQPRK
ncbi:MAG: hypothetical protein KatS3mg055_1239 [Chloroflexus sp.]|nr:MAG: hypothetical protein KatS3mg055_1239 [Chloroflexus sp.]